MKRYSGAAALLLLAGCLNAADTTNTISLPFDIDADGIGEGWTVGVADVPEAELPNVNFVGDLRVLPASLPNRDALYLAGNSVNGTIFMFQQRRFTGLLPNEQYEVALEAEFASNFNQGCTTGLGPATFIKAGVALIEPAAEPDAQGILRMTIDKGTGATAGDYVQLGDIRNGLTGCPVPGLYAIQTTVMRSQSLRLVTDAFGGFWLWIGIESTAAGRPEIYVGGIIVTLTH
ncbi:MAG TPA: hypothetical protein VLB00_01060 [Gemmatimonadales bacterium]|nr:hypothetical protein [Gemmatimonadales bacterium]